MTEILSLLQIGSVETEQAQALCVIHELACDRARVRTSLPLRPDEAVRIGMRGGQELEGQVIAHDGRHATIALAQRVDPGALLKDNRRAASGAESVRIALAQPVEIVALDRRIVQSIDISLQGLRLTDEAALLRPGEAIAVAIDGLGLHHGRVMWAQDGQAGLRFHHSLGFDRLDRWLRGRGGKGAPAFGAPDRLADATQTG